MPDMFNEPSDAEIIAEILEHHGPLTSRELWEEFKSAAPERMAAVADSQGANWARRTAERIDPSTGLPRAGSVVGDDGQERIHPERLFDVDAYTQQIVKCVKRMRADRGRAYAWGDRCYEVTGEKIDVDELIELVMDAAEDDQDDEGGEL